MLKKITSPIKRLRAYYKAFEGATLRAVLVDEILGRERERIIKIGDFQVHARTNTADLKVIISSLYEKEYEPIKCENPKVIIDAGANIGTSCIFFAEKYPDAKIFSIEPEGRNYALLVKNTEKYKNVVTIKAALWGVSDERTLQSRHTGHWGYTVSETSNDIESTGQKIKCITMESIIEEHGIESIDLLKMDIEGGEKEVLENSHGWVGLVKIMTVELHDRIVMGCDRAFYLATKDFQAFEKFGEKITASRN